MPPGSDGSPAKGVGTGVAVGRSAIAVAVASTAVAVAAASSVAWAVAVAGDDCCGGLGVGDGHRGLLGWLGDDPQTLGVFVRERVPHASAGHQRQARVVLGIDGRRIRIRALEDLADHELCTAGRATSR